MNQPDIIQQLRNQPEYEDHEPQHDYIFVKPLADTMMSKGGLHMPNVPDPTGNKRSSGPCLVVAVGPGPWTDRVDDNGQFLRRPMCCDVGDIVVYQGGQFLVNVNGEQLHSIQDYQVVDCRRLKAPTLKAIEERCADGRHPWDAGLTDAEFAKVKKELEQP